MQREKVQLMNQQQNVGITVKDVRRPSRDAVVVQLEILSRIVTPEERITVDRAKRLIEQPDKNSRK